MSSLYLREDLDAANVEVGNGVSIEGAEARHAVTVNRARVGERTTIGDGRGLLVGGVIVTARADRLEILVDQIDAVPPAAPRITLVQALAKGDRDELAIQAATELGVDAVVPWAAERSVSRWTGDKLLKGSARWASIVREATKQSIRAWLPDVADLATTRQIAAWAGRARVLVLEPTAERSLAEFRFGADGDGALDLVLVVGPEGGITPPELDLLTAAGAVPLRLGDLILRTSTAGPAALAVLNSILGRW